MKGLENIKKIKSPKVSPKSRSNKSYEKYLKGSEKRSENRSEKDNKSQNKKIIKVQRKRKSPQRVNKDIRDIKGTMDYAFKLANEGK